MDDHSSDRSSKKLTIAFMNSIRADVWRGGEKWMVNAASGLLTKGHNVICIGRDDAVWLQNASSRGVRTISLPIHGDFDPIIISRLVVIFKKLKPDILCCNFEKDVRLGGIAAKIAGVKMIYVRKGLSLLYDKLRYKLAYKYIVNRIISPAHFIKNQFVKFSWLDQNRIDVVHNGVVIPDTQNWDNHLLRKELNLNENTKILFAAGSLFGQKGFEYLIEAVGKVRSNGHDVHLAIAGAGDFDKYTNIAKQANLGSYIHLLGHRKNITELMYSADIFVLSSIDEGLPNVVLEAMSVGTPVVAADAGGTSEIITDGQDGFVVPIKDSQAIADALVKLLSNEELMKDIGKLGLETAKVRFSIPRMVDEVEMCFLKASQSVINV